ncbi:hypothetical protein [Algoriphagus pacificus]|uniref:Outer membrane protein beta-barrel domain-containing protein n=1 Tax=Algoriphagus pacificus TaxID=2811234 RepID=A0ABS3CJV6_9BACT|nr:hypothetical protein [Algoriphagus pacificus]MBN7816824.1 hypothetical protein [Algoriphagus pacificus]
MKNTKSLFNPILAIFGALFFFISIESKAQSKAEIFTAKNIVYLDLGGNAGQYAVTYGRVFHQKGKLKLSASAGFSMWYQGSISNTRWLPAIPVELTAFYGKSKHHLELGAGVTSYLGNSIYFDQETFESVDKVVFGAILPVRIGYRYQKPNGGFFFRVGYTPLINIPIREDKTWNFEPRFAGLSFGKSF